MNRTLSAFVFLLVCATPVFAQNACNLSMTLECTATGACTAVTTNNGSSVCTGEFVTGFIAQTTRAQATIGGFHNSLGLTECFDSSFLPTVPVPIVLCFGDASLHPGGSFTTSAQVSSGNGAPNSVPVEAATIVIDTLESANIIGEAFAFNNLTTPTCTPQASVAAQVQSGVTYTVSWSPVVDPNATFTVDESTTADFSANVVSRQVSGFASDFQHSVTSPTNYYYRVRANSCGGAPGPNSPTVSIIVIPVPTVTGRTGDAVTPFGSTTPVSLKVFIPSPSGSAAPGGLTAQADPAFNVSTDRPYLTVNPPSGTIPPGGTTVTVTANPSNLPVGANTGSLTITSNGATSSKSVSVSLVTPVSPNGKTLPPPNSLIIPVVAHGPGALGPFQSDVRVTNAGVSSVKYQINYAPSRTDATQTGRSTTLEVGPGQTAALNDIVRDFFGIGTTDNPADQGAGALEIRPLNTSALQSFASSRTFTFNAKGTFGQFIAAIPFSQFATNAAFVPIPGVPSIGASKLSLQQIAQSARFRTNFGIVEGSGTPATGNIKIYNDAGQLLKTVPYSLLPGEHQQLNTFLSTQGIALDDGRIEVTVDSQTGAVTAYASVLDNTTNDPLAVTPVDTTNVSATRFVLPGMAALGGTNNFHSDVRLFNGGASAVTVTPTFYPQGPNTTPKQIASFTINAGEVKAFDDIVVSQFGLNGVGGSIVFTTPSPSSLVASGRTFTIDSSGGTFGQFIPGVTPTDGIGVGDRPLQVLQLEQSPNFRANVGLAELTGNPVDLKVTAYIPDAKASPFLLVHLEPNEFRQIGSVLANIGSELSTAYNGRVSIEVTGGSGRVAAYGSVIDNASLDPTYVPAQ